MLCECAAGLSTYAVAGTLLQGQLSVKYTQSRHIAAPCGCPVLLDSHRGDPYTPSLAQAAIRVCFSTIGFDFLGVLDA